MPSKAPSIQQPSISLIQDQTTQYSEDVASKKILAGPLVRLACERHLRDIANAHKRGFYWDAASAKRAIDFFPDILRLSEGEYFGTPFVLQPWQQFIVGSLFGWKSVDGFRRFRDAYVEVGKGNGKSPLAAGIGLYMLCADGEASAECYAAATMRDQAGILFRDAVRMVDASPALKSRIIQSGSMVVFNLTHLSSGSYFRPVSSEHKGLDGKRVHFAAIDELHEHPTSLVVDKMRAGTKGRRQALVFRITNSGFDRASVCWAEHEYSQKIVERQLVDDAWFGFVCSLDDKDDWTDESVWIKPNPNLGVSIPLKYLREQVTIAKGMPSKQNIVKRLNFCVWTNQENAAIKPEDWEPCAGIVGDPVAVRDQVLEKLAGRPCFIGTDLSAKQDLTAVVKLFPPQDDDTPLSGKYIVIADFWIPEDTAEQRGKESRGAAYDVWIRQGFIHTTPGNVIDYKAIEAKILEDFELYDVRELAFDPYLATSLSNDLQAEGIDVERLVEFPQTFKVFTGPTKELLEAILPGLQLAHLGNPVLSWNAYNLIVLENNNGDMRPIKKKTYGKIDGMVALLMALGRAIANPEGGSQVYDGPEEVFLA
jgi:phage terminase large subunit-like protein